MVKFCLPCKRGFWGVQFSPIRPGAIELLDAALPVNKKYLTELNIDVRPKYYARSSMLLSCFGFVMALPLGAFVFLRGLASSGNVELWAGVGIGTIVFISWGCWYLAHRLFDKQMEDVETEDKEPQLD